MDIVLLGPPGAGKGTQAKRLTAWLSVPHVSSGDLFRSAIQEGTELGQKAQEYIKSGELVPDEVTAGMVAERLAQPDCEDGVVLDGFPRTVPQAKALDDILENLGRQLDAVIYIQVSQEEVLRRLLGRWVCSECGAVYHRVFNPEKVEGICDQCGGKLHQREDDTPEVQQQRFAVYLAETAPLADYYERRGTLLEVNGEQEPDAVASDIRQVIENLERQGG